MWVDFDVREKQEMDFFTGGSRLWIMDSYFDLKHLKLKCLNEGLFLTNTVFHFTGWTGVVWIIVMFLSAVWTLILTAPIHCRGSISDQIM